MVMIKDRYNFTYDTDTFFYVEGIVEVPSCDKEFDYIEMEAGIWYEPLTESPVIVEPFSTLENGKRLYCTSRQTDFKLVEVYEQYQAKLDNWLKSLQEDTSGLDEVSELLAAYSDLDDIDLDDIEYQLLEFQEEI